MKTFIILLFTVLFLYSCGSDNPVTNNNNNGTTDSLIYSRDSLVVYNSNFAGFQIDSLPANKYRITYQGITNDSSVNTLAEVSATYYQDSTHILLDDAFTGNAINTSYDKTATLTPNNNNLVINIGCAFLQTLTGKYIKMKNIKIYIVH